MPAPLGWLLAAVLTLGVTWALLVPPAQAPDEPVHVAYVQSLVDRGEPPTQDEREGLDVFSTEQKAGRRASNYEAAIQQPSVRPEWRASEDRAWREAQDQLGERRGVRADGGASNPAAGNPPLYYLWSAIPYAATASFDLFTRWYAMRLWAVLLLGLAVLATWLMVGELTRRDRLLQLAGSGFVGLAAGASAISAAVNPDAAMIATWALVLWLGVRLLRRAPSLAGVVALLVATIAALLVKASSFGLLPAVALVLAVTARRALGNRRVGRRALAGAGAVVAGGTALVVVSGAADRLVAGLSRSQGTPYGFLSYLWQAYLPNLPFQTAVRNLPAFWAYDVWVKSAWGNFGWSELLLPEPVHVIIALALAAILTGAALALARGRFPRDGAVLGFLGTAVAALVLGLHWGEYNQFLDIHLSLLQGRYLLPLLPVGGLAVVAALANLAPARRAPAAGLLLAGLFALQLLSLGIVVGRFHA